MTNPENHKVVRFDNHRIFRAEAVEAYTTRRAGDVWLAKIRGEAWIAGALTLLAVAALIVLMRGVR